MKALYGDWKTTLPKDCLHPGELIDKEMLFHFKNNANSEDKFAGIIQMEEVADIIGGKPIYDTIYKENECTPWIYAGQCSTFHIVTVDNVISEGMAAEIDYMTDTLLLTGRKTNFSQLGLEKLILNRMER